MCAYLNLNLQTLYPKHAFFYPDPFENHKTAKSAFNFGPLLASQQNAI